MQQPTPDDRDLIEARSLRRRQVLDALLRGEAGPPGPSADVTRRGLVLGISLSAAIAAAAGIAGLANAGRPHNP